MDLAIGDPPGTGLRGPGRTGQRHRRRGLPGPPADHDPGRGPRRGRPPAGLPAPRAGQQRGSPGGHHLARRGTLLRQHPQRPARVHPGGPLHGAAAAPDRLRATALRHRRQRGRHAPGRGALLAGHHRPLHPGRAPGGHRRASSTSASSRPTRSRWRCRSCCHRWPRRSSAARPSSVGRGGYSGTIVGAIILQVHRHDAPRARRCRRARAASSSGSSSWPSRQPTRASPRSGEAERHGGHHAPHRPRPGRHQHQVGAGGARRWRLADARPGPGADRRVRRREDRRAAAGPAGHRGPGPGGRTCRRAWAWRCPASTSPRPGWSPS